jgi:rhodanese-related sulfurtransferase
MKTQSTLIRTATHVSLGLFCIAAQAQTPNNPKVDMDGFLRDAKQAASHRVDRIKDQKQFFSMAAEQGTIVLDARSADKFAMLHVKGAQNLPFTDFTAESLAKLIPNKASRILIYCNNNFSNAPVAMPGKSIAAALNLSTLVSLRSYGYLNVYELGGYIDVNRSELPLEGTTASAKR